MDHLLIDPRIMKPQRIQKLNIVSQVEKDYNNEFRNRGNPSLKRGIYIVPRRMPPKILERGSN